MNETNLRCVQGLECPFAGQKAGNKKCRERSDEICLCVHGCHGPWPDRHGLLTDQEGVPLLQDYPGMKGLKGDKKEGGVLVSYLITQNQYIPMSSSIFYHRPLALD